MSEQITPFIEHFYEDGPILERIASIPTLSLTFESRTLQQAGFCVVVPLVVREKGFRANQFNLLLLIRHAERTELGELELLSIKDFIRQKVDVGPAMQYIEQITGASRKAILDRIKIQVQFLQNPDNKDLPSAPATMLTWEI